MRYILVFVMAICMFLTGCEYVIPHTSDAISQSKQVEELHQQTQQLERQTEALERLSNAVEQMQLKQ